MQLLIDDLHAYITPVISGDREGAFSQCCRPAEHTRQLWQMMMRYTAMRETNDRVAAETEFRFIHTSLFLPLMLLFVVARNIIWENYTLRDGNFTLGFICNLPK